MGQHDEKEILAEETDTSLGADLLEDVYSGESIKGASGLFETTPSPDPFPRKDHFPSFILGMIGVGAVLCVVVYLVVGVGKPVPTPAPTPLARSANFTELSREQLGNVFVSRIKDKNSGKEYLIFSPTIADCQISVVPVLESNK
jgi:hypothetical protein